jgi:hypothetical protein
MRHGCRPHSFRPNWRKSTLHAVNPRQSQVTSVVRKVHKNARRFLPNSYALNRALMLPVFYRYHGRWPQHPSREDASLSDFIFDRGHRDNWTEMQLRCTDKEHMKVAVRELSHLARTPETFEVISFEPPPSFERFRERLSAHFGTARVAKPTHSSGSIVFLRHPDETAIRKLFAAACLNFFHVYRECQYDRLARKVIVEENIAGDADLRDYKFFCTYGEILFCQIDIDRHTAHKRALVSPPFYAPIPQITLGTIAHLPQVTVPGTFPAMCEVAAEISRNFDFVRIDLYDAPGGIFAGEITFTPGAGLEPFSSERFAADLLRRIKARTGPSRITPPVPATPPSA